MGKWFNYGGPIGLQKGYMECPDLAYPCSRAGRLPDPAFSRAIAYF
jgi:hypothetical protein